MANKGSEMGGGDFLVKTCPTVVPGEYELHALEIINLFQRQYYYIYSNLNNSLLKEPRRIEFLFREGAEHD